MIQNLFPFFPELSHIESIDQIPVFTTTAEGRFGCAFRMEILDLESKPFRDYLFTAIRRLVPQMKEGVTLRVRVSGMKIHELPFPHVREEAVERFGGLSEEVILVFEGEPHNSWGWGKASGKKNSLHGFVSNLPLSCLNELGCQKLTEGELALLFKRPACEIVKNRKDIDTGESRVGVIRLWKPGVFTLSEATLAKIKEDLPLPYEFSVTIQKISRPKTQFILKQKLEQEASSSDPLAQRSYQESVRALEETALDGDGVIEMEWLLVLKRLSERELRLDVQDALDKLYPLGEVVYETSGSYPSFRATFLGSTPHFTFLEKASQAWAYLPLFSYGASLPRRMESSPRTIPFLREDTSFYLFDPYHSNHLAYCAVINGETGSGKSALSNLLVKSLLNDPKVSLILIDVGSSYLNLCELTGGKYIDLTMDRPSGLNPFRAIQEFPFSNSIVETLSTFICALIKEPNEAFVPSEIEVELEKRVRSYSEARVENPSLDDFVSHFPNLPRVHLFSRWTRGGVYENVFRQVESPSQNAMKNRFLYFNIPNLDEAKNENFCGGIMAAVIAFVNFELFRCGDARKGSGEKLVFFADETKFFIERNLKFFSQTTANFRKYSHATILVSQSTKAFIGAIGRGENGDQIDATILSNSPIRFFFQIDGSHAEFQERFNLTDEQMERLGNIYKGKAFRECLMQDSIGARICRIRLTEEEHWTATTHPKHVEKMAKLLNAVPGLTRRQAIQCLALGEPLFKGEN